MTARGWAGALRATAIALASLAAAIGVPLVFINSGSLAGAIGSALRLEVDPALVGGKALAEFSDPLGDDAGPGGYEYPMGLGADKGELDLTRYTVRAPVARPVWSGSAAFWQLEAVFASAAPAGLAGGGFRAPVVHLYIDLDGAASGSTESAFGEGELLRFDPAHPWDYAITADGWSMPEIRSADGAYRAPVDASWDLKRRRLTLRVGLIGAPRLLMSVLDGRQSWHYVLVGAFDGAREGHFAAIREYAGLHEGGGAHSDAANGVKGDLAPRVFDLLAPAGTSQARELGSADEAKGLVALVEPIAVGGQREAAPSAGQELRAQLERETAQEAKKDQAERERRIAALKSGPASGAAETSAAISELFSLGLEDQARAAIGARLAKRKDDAFALAYRGALVAKEASRAAGVGDKVRLVGEAYRDLDAAVAALGAAAPEERLAILLCRGSVSSAVPNDVFGRAAQGAADFEAAAALARSGGDTVQAASCLAGAALAYEKAGRSEEADSRWATLAAERGLGPATRLELLDRGFAPGSVSP